MYTSRAVRWGEPAHGGPASPPRWPFGRHPRFRARPWLAEVSQYGIERPLLFAICGGVRVHGVANLEWQGGPFVFVANHASHLDTLAVRAALPPPLRRRLMVAAAADYFFRWRVVGTLLRCAIGAIPAARAGSGIGGLRECLAAIAAGSSVLIFPEGTRSLAGRGAFRDGAAWLACRAGVPVVPLLIEGTPEGLPRGACLPKRTTISVHIGPPLPAGHEGDRRRYAERIVDAFEALRQQADASPRRL